MVDREVPHHHIHRGQRVPYRVHDVLINKGYQRAQKEINDLKNKNTELEKQTVLDPYTELFNKKHFEDTLKMMDEKRKEPHLERRNNNGLPSKEYIMVFDIDDFKDFNENYGHSIGDKVIKSVAATIKQNIRPTDMAFRIGGDEFAVIFMNTYMDFYPESIKMRIQNRCNSISIEDNNIKGVGVSVGIAKYDEQEGDTCLMDTYKRADEVELRKAKESKNVGR